MQSFVDEKGWNLLKQYKDIGSGLNDKRKGFIQLIKDLPVLQPALLIVNYGDRLTRFGLNILETICSIFNTKILVVSSYDTKRTFEAQLVDDIVAILYFFSGELYRSRRK